MKRDESEKYPKQTRPLPKVPITHFKHKIATRAILWVSTCSYYLQPLGLHDEKM